jgi:hypothetical protein
MRIDNMAEQSDVETVVSPYMPTVLRSGYTKEAHIDPHLYFLTHSLFLPKTPI